LKFFGLSALDSAVVSIGTFNAGYNANVIADSAEISGTIRGFDQSVMDLVHRRVEEISSGIELSFGVKIEFEFSDPETIYPVTSNVSADCVKNVITAASKVVPAQKILPPRSTLGAEDFSFFLNERPGCFFFVGCYPGETDASKDVSFEYLDRPHHKSNFDLHEDALGVGASIWVHLIEDLLMKFETRHSSPKRLRK
jgi:metal-dependent amidase/aminoacylase/carboxypeptidase family protein